jgi:Protein of unknown function (DUF4019)
MHSKTIYLSHNTNLGIAMRILVLSLFFAFAAWFASGAAAQVDPSAQPLHNVAPPATEPNWRPTPEQKDLIGKVTMDYFAAKDSGRAQDAYGLLSPRQKQNLPFDSYRQLLDEFNTKSGKVEGRQLRAVTWYKDSPQAGLGLYVAVDYSSQFPNLALHCGYVVWQEQADGSLLLVREEANVIDNATMAKLKPDAIEKARKQFRC